MHFLVFSRVAPHVANLEDDPALHEAHWSYIDRFAGGLIARGPTLAADRETWTGSVHILELPSAEAAHDFVEDEPYNRAGLFEQHLIRRFENRLGRTMWEFPAASDDPRFMVLVHGAPPPDLTAQRERLIVHGELLTPEEGRPAGVVLALQAPTRQAVEALLDAPSDVEIHDWEFGGRR